jgi:hypothetical protein
MKSRTFLRALFASTIGLSPYIFVPVAAGGRLMHPWTFQELAAKSDLIEIIEAIRDDSATDSFKPDSLSRFVAINTCFRVHAVLKGEVEDKKITVLHFRDEEDVANGPMCADFSFSVTYNEERFVDGKRVGSASSGDAHRPMWLAFLKKRADGRFEPVTGHYDSALSFCIMPQKDCSLHIEDYGLPSK